MIRTVTLLVLGASYFLTAKFSLQLAVVHPSASAVWPPSGLALAALTVLGSWAWPGVLAASFLVNLTTAGSVATSAGIAVGNTLEALLGAYLLSRFVRGRYSLQRARDIFRFGLFAGVVSTAVSATIGVTTLSLGGFAAWPRFGEIWLTWWLGNAAGNVVVAPALILWSNDHRLRASPRRWLEVVLLFGCIIAVSDLAFNEPPFTLFGRFPVGLLCIPLLMWVVFQFGPRGTSLAILVMSGMAVRGALRGLGPFAQGSEHDPLLMVPLVTGVAGMVAVAVAASIQERRRLEAVATHLAAIVESSYDAIIGKTTDGLIVSWNRGAECMFGYSAEEAVGQPLSLMVAQGREQEEARILESVKRDEVIRGLETVRVRKDGAPIHVSLTVSPVRDTRGRIVGASSIARDITSQKQNEITAREMNLTLKAWVGKLERQTQEIALLNQMIHLLQTCQVPEEVYALAGPYIEQLFPGDSGAVFANNAGVSLLESVAVWGKTPPSERVFSGKECWALRLGEVHAMRRKRETTVCQHVHADPPADRLCVPMTAQGEALGILHLRCGSGEAGSPEEAGSLLTPSKEHLAVSVAGHIALALANLRLRDSLRSQSVRDPLTGLYNRRYLQESLEREIRRSARTNRPVAIIMVDVDHFKQFNDSLGHEAGDAVLRELGSFLQNRVRAEDIPCRYGGDEFVIIVADTAMEVALRRARQLQDEIKRLSIPWGGNFLDAPTVSLGVAVCPEHAATASGLLRAADEALYRAKAQGRDCVAVGPPDGRTQGPANRPRDDVH